MRGVRLFVQQFGDLFDIGLDLSTFIGLRMLLA
jgi:hypothetical protein